MCKTIIQPNDGSPARQCTHKVWNGTDLCWVHHPDGKDAKRAAHKKRSEEWKVERQRIERIALEGNNTRRLRFLLEQMGISQLRSLGIDCRSLDDADEAIDARMKELDLTFSWVPE